MGCSETWKILDEIIIEFRKQDSPVPETVMNDLKSAKTLIELLETGEDRGEFGLKIEQYLSSVEANLVTEAQKFFPSEKIDEWLKRLEGSSCDLCHQVKEVRQKEERFVSGVPRDQKWIRVSPIVNLPREKIEELAQNSGLSTWAEKDGHLVVCGPDEGIKDFVRKMTKEAAQ